MAVGRCAPSGATPSTAGAQKNVAQSGHSCTVSNTDGLHRAQHQKARSRMVCSTSKTWQAEVCVRTLTHESGHTPGFEEWRASSNVKTRIQGLPRADSNGSRTSQTSDVNVNQDARAACHPFKGKNAGSWSASCATHPDFTCNTAAHSSSTSALLAPPPAICRVSTTAMPVALLAEFSIIF